MFKWFWTIFSLGAPDIVFTLWTENTTTWCQVGHQKELVLIWITFSHFFSLNALIFCFASILVLGNRLIASTVFFFFSTFDMGKSHKSCWKYLSLVRFAHSWGTLSALEDKIRIPARPCNILYFSVILRPWVWSCAVKRSTDFSRLLHLIQFVKCWQFFLELNSKRLYQRSVRLSSCVPVLHKTWN